MRVLFLAMLVDALHSAHLCRPRRRVIIARARRHFIANGMRPMLSTICRAAYTSTVSPLRAASAKHFATCCHVDFLRVSAGKWPSTSSRTSQSVLSVITCGKYWPMPSALAALS
jgi:hypothetical protein